MLFKKEKSLFEKGSQLNDQRFVKKKKKDLVLTGKLKAETGKEILGKKVSNLRRTGC